MFYGKKEDEMKMIFSNKHISLYYGKIGNQNFWGWLFTWSWGVTKWGDREWGLRIFGFTLENNINE